eukprot:SAG22_NODE_2392_length_2623_cov_5.797544_3_plen_51_part_00
MQGDPRVIFGSMRFPHGNPPKEAIDLQISLLAKNIDLKIILLRVGAHNWN